MSIMLRHFGARMTVIEADGSGHVCPNVPDPALDDRGLAYRGSN
jgi:hypothetical protein